MGDAAKQASASHSSHCKLGMLAPTCGIIMGIQIFSGTHTSHTFVFSEPAHQPETLQAVRK